MTSFLMRMALAGLLTVASVLGLVGISGLIIFADVQRPQPAAIVQSQSPGPSVDSGALTFSGPNQ
ncbi:MAG: hypothetical protein K8S25_11360 [Alphaproteobacteria bacterium]|nr:hypothetical protein [Alphaproteobacteria bacterium]